jgi:hypothetical protein
MLPYEWQQPVVPQFVHDKLAVVQHALTNVDRLVEHDSGLAHLHEDEILVEDGPLQKSRFGCELLQLFSRVDLAVVY